MIRSVITVVSGIPRSGTSLMMRMLEAGGVPVYTDGVRKADLHNPDGYYECERVRRLAADSSWLAEAQGKAIKIISHLLRHLPSHLSYRVIFMVRDRKEVIRSQNKMMDLADDSTNGDARLTKTFRREVAAALAHLQGLPHCRVLTVDYADLLTEDPSRVLGELNAFLGGGLDCSRMLPTIRRKTFVTAQRQSELAGPGVPDLTGG